MKQRTSKILLILALLTGTVYVSNNLMSQSLTTEDRELQELQELVDSLSDFLRYFKSTREKNPILQSITELVDKQSSENLKKFKSNQQKPLLHFAISENYTPLIKKLASKVDINETYDNQTPLEYLNPAHQSDIMKALILSGADINKLGSYRKISPQEYIAGLLIEAQQLDDSEVNIAAKESLNEAYNIYNALITLKDSFDNNISFNTIKESINPNYIGLFIMNRVNQNPSELTRLKDYFHSIDILDSIKDYIQFANPEALKVIQQAINKETQIKKLANQQDKNQLTDIEILTQN